MEPDFAGYATKAGVKCSDGLTIMPDAFKGQDSMRVPLVWQHGHKDPENVLGHAILENRKDGVYTYAFFNDTPKAQHAKELVQHKDVTMMSIWANQLIKRANQVFHGAIREVSLVISGANPGALIDPVTIRHSDGTEDEAEDEAIIYTGLSFEHSNDGELVVHEDEVNESNIPEIFETLNDDQKEMVHSLLSDALMVSGSGIDHASGDPTLQQVIDSMTDIQKQALEWMVGLAATGEGGSSVAQSDLGDDKNDDNNDNNDEKGAKEMKHNVFEDQGGSELKSVELSHEDKQELLTSFKRTGSLKHAMEEYALAHNITDIDTLFPDAVNLDQTPQFLQRRTEWVNSFLSATRKSPFNRIKNVWADITEEDARAKGYITGTLKKEEFFSVAKRETTPTTVYKKQKLDRDDVVDITEFDVVLWLKGEMRIMLDEEIARAALIGDGRDISSEDKINEQNIRPIATEHELFATTVNINMLDANSSISEFIDAVIRNRRLYKGSGQPTLFTSETVISSFLLLKDTLGRSLYPTLAEVASVLRVAAIVPVEAMEDDTSLVAIMVNPIDYVMGATQGGQVSMFDDFDIDYNQQKYLIETRLCGCLTVLKSAIIFRQRTSGSDVLIVPSAPTFDAETGQLTIVNTAHVVYKRTDTDAVVTAGSSPYTIPSGDSITIEATADAGYYFESSDVDNWTFTAE